MMRIIWIALLLALIVGGWFWLRGGSYPIRNAPPGAGTIVAFGDSLTFGYGAPQGQGYVDALAEKIGRPIVNSGIPGNTIEQAHQRLTHDVLDFKPSIVIVLLGGNDYLQQKDLARSLADLKEIVREIQARGAMVVLVGLEGLLPFSGYNKKYAAIAR